MAAFNGGLPVHARGLFIAALSAIPSIGRWSRSRLMREMGGPAILFRVLLHHAQPISRLQAQPRQRRRAI